MKITDDMRILACMREGFGLEYERQGSRWPKWDGYRLIGPDGAGDRYVSGAAFWRARDAGLIVTDDNRGYSLYDDYTSMYRLTEAGQAAAAGVALSIEDALRRPVETTKEERERNRIRAGARKTLKTLVEGGKRLQSCFRHGETCFWIIVPNNGGWGRHYVKIDVVAALAPYLESCEDPNPLRRWDPGEPKDLQPNAAGIEAIKERKPLNLGPAKCV